MKKLCFIFYSMVCLMWAGAALAAPQQLTASDGTAMDGFGESLAADGNVAVVGAPGADIGGNADQGAAYVYVRRGGAWEEAAKLVSSDGGANDGFGTSVAVSRNTIVVGAPDAAAEGVPTRGAAYVFRKRGGGWQQSAKLFAADGITYDDFGAAVGIDKRTIVVGVPNASGEFGPPGSYTSGAVYVFEAKGRDWQQTDKLRPRASSFMQYFGGAVDIDGDTVVIGSPVLNDHEGGGYVFERGPAGWQEVASFFPARQPFAVSVGIDVAVEDGVVALGAPGEGFFGEVYRSGRVYVFTKEESGWTRFHQRLAASDRQVNGGFGTGVDLVDGRLAIGASPAGSAYLFRDGESGWTETERLSVPASSYSYGHLARLARDAMLVADPVATIDGNVEQGAVYVHDL